METVVGRRTLVVDLRFSRHFIVELGDEYNVDLFGGTFFADEGDRPPMFVGIPEDYQLQRRDTADSILVIARSKLETRPHQRLRYVYSQGVWDPLDWDQPDEERPTLLEHLVAD